MVFYLKYRPKKISELDSLLLRERLESVLKGNLPDKIPHAFLFTGPKGLGKTSTARILAKTINCTNRKKGEIEPCNKCLSCKSITAGTNLDVLEIDAASNRGIDEIRDLREKIRLSPVSSLKKVYIIDEVHMLTSEAFNALLKTLEEPPSHAIFILCTTEPQKVPATISSRCFNIKFTWATDDDLVSSFKRIIKGEGLESDKEGLLEIAKLSDGSFRDGAKILEELSLHSKNITKSLVEKKYNTASIEKSVLDLIASFEKKDAERGIKILDQLSKESVDFKIFLESLIGTLHKKLLEEIKNNQQRVNDTKNLIELLVRTHGEIKYSVLPQLPLELAVVEYCLQGTDSVQREEEEVVLQKTQEQEKAQTSTKDDKILQELIADVKSENFSIAGVLRSCSVEKLDDRSFTLSTKFAFHKEKLSDPKIIDLIEAKLKEGGHNLKFSVTLRG